MNQSESTPLSTPQEPWLTQAITELRQPLAPSVAGQIRAARRQALTRSTIQTKSRFGHWALASGFATASLVFGLVLNTMIIDSPPNSTVMVQTIAPDDLPIMTAQDELQFYQNLEFLRWLEKEQHHEHKG